MFQSTILPFAQKKLATKKLLQREFWRCFGKGESQIYHMIAPTIDFLEKKYPDTFVFGVHISFPCIDLTMESWQVKGKKSPSKQELQNAIVDIQAKVNDVSFSRDRKSLVDIVSTLLQEKQLTLSTVESCTGGLLGKMFTDLSGSSSFYLGGVIPYSNEAKKQFLDVSESVLKKFGAVSEETVKEMAENARKKFRSDFTIALSGISGPNGGTQKKPVGTICIALASAKGTKTLRQVILNSAGSREQNRLIAAHLALDALRTAIISY